MVDKRHVELQIQLNRIITKNFVKSNITNAELFSAWKRFNFNWFVEFFNSHVQSWL